ncbi:Ferredoxin--NADP reductase, root isozyme, chloroplastic [Sesamum angolense]|uniref:ferredoxin--NADP(+) reductase n=1 Tax=Sesamum angolense TaxID=2727404 RepID=A0AAE1W434_9LAMI|nr:Ferredoxin--NADP reductase, root isozyme, chloroplastic [Sesamum angolense]
MSHSAITLVPVAVSINADTSLPKSVFKYLVLFDHVYLDELVKRHTRYPWLYLDSNITLLSRARNRDLIVGQSNNVSFHELQSNNVSFHDKSWNSRLSLDFKIANSWTRGRPVVCMSVQQASHPKVAVSPLSLEDAKDPPLHLYKNKEPYTGTIVFCRKGMATSLMARQQVYVFDVLSIMILRPEKKTLRKKEYAATFLCDSKPGDKVKITGPSGKIMLLPEDDPNATHIMIATGTGVAPFRGYLRRMFMENVPTFKFGGLAWLFLGVANSDSLLYDDEFSKYLRDYPDNFRYDRALSREQKNRNGGKMYVQDKIEEYSDEIFKLLDNGAHIYFCGLKGMMRGIQDTLKKVAEQRGESWDEKLSQLKKNKQWHVEVY